MALNLEDIRREFPVLSQTHKGKPLIYFDNACMTMKPTRVIEAANRYYLEHPSCHNRAVHHFGKKTSEAFSSAREVVAKHINADKKEEIIFTRNTTEAINLVAHSIGMSSDQSVITSDFEHNSNLLPWQFLSHRQSITHETYSIDLDGNINLEELESHLKKGHCKLVSTFFTSHVTGLTQPIKQIAELAHQYKALILVDGAQALPHHKIDVKDLDIDFLAFSFHKAFGPTGTGALWGREDLLKKFDPFMTGGETVLDVDYHNCTLSPLPERLEAGLQDYAGAMGGAAAINFLNQIGIESIQEHENKLVTQLSNELSQFDKIKIIGNSGSVVNFYVDGFDSGELSILLDKTSNIMLRSGVHCCHAWYHKQELAPTLRASFSLYNTEEEVAVLIQTLKDFLKYY